MMSKRYELRKVVCVVCEMGENRKRETLLINTQALLKDSPLGDHYQIKIPWDNDDLEEMYKLIHNVNQVHIDPENPGDFAFS